MNLKIAVAPPVPRPTSWARTCWQCQASHPRGEWGATDFQVQGKSAAKTEEEVGKHIRFNCDAIG